LVLVLGEFVSMTEYDFEVLRGEQVVFRPASVQLEGDSAAWPVLRTLGERFQSSDYRIRVRGPGGETVIFIDATAAALACPEI
jgi:hypothetical protein